MKVNGSRRVGDRKQLRWIANGKDAIRLSATIGNASKLIRDMNREPAIKAKDIESVELL